MLKEPAECLGVVHVPKSGGTAIKNALEVISCAYIGPLYFDHAHFGSERLVQGVPSPNAETVATTADIAAVVETHRAVIGHYAGPTLLEAGCTDLAVQVREPRSRILSLYRFWEAQAEEERSGWGLWGSELVAAADRPLAAFLRSNAVWPATDNAMHRQVFGMGRARRRGLRGLLRPGDSNRGRAVIGSVVMAEWADRSETFLKRLCTSIGVTDVPVLGRDNVTSVRGPAQDIDHDALELLEQLTRRDVSLLEELMRAGLLEPRSPDELDEEFRRTLRRLSFRLAT